MAFEHRTRQCNGLNVLGGYLAVNYSNFKVLSRYAASKYLTTWIEHATYAWRMPWWAHRIEYCFLNGSGDDCVACQVNARFAAYTGDDIISAGPFLFNSSIAIISLVRAMPMAGFIGQRSRWMQTNRRTDAVRAENVLFRKRHTRQRYLSAEEKQYYYSSFLPLFCVLCALLVRFGCFFLCRPPPQFVLFPLFIMCADAIDLLGMTAKTLDLSKSRRQKEACRYRAANARAPAPRWILCHWYWL